MKHKSSDSQPRSILAAALFLCATLAATSLQAGDWPRWRGPAGDGTIAGGNWNPAALKDGPSIVWTREVGTGYSSVAVVGNRVYTQGNQGDSCVIYCLDADTGAEVWTRRYPAGSNNQPGSRSTPTVDGNLVYVSGREGDMLCLDAADGAVKWTRNLLKEESLPNVTWGLACSPLVSRTRVYLNIGEHGFALDKQTGKTIWRSPAEPAGYATPVPYSAGGEEALAVFASKAIFAVRASDGKVLWSMEWRTSYDINAADPIVVGNRMYISSGYKRGAALLDVSGPAPAPVWESKEVCNQFGTPVLLDGNLYGCSGNTGKGRLQCVRMDTGEVLWTEDSGFCSVILVDDKLVVLNEEGLLSIGKASPQGFSAISSGKVLHKKVCWTPPAFANGRIYCRNHPGTLVCIDASK